MSFAEGYALDDDQHHFAGGDLHDGGAATAPADEVMPGCGAGDVRNVQQIAPQNPRPAGKDAAAPASMWQQVLASIGEGVMTVDASGGITWMNGVAEALTGWHAAEALGRPLRDVLAVFHEADPAQTRDPLEGCRRYGAAVPMPADHCLRRRDGTGMSIEGTVAPVSGAEAAVIVFRDVTDRRRAEREAVYRATHDPLTGLLNRKEFERILAERLADRDARLGSFLFLLDLDYFKRVNYAAGHAVGDLLLRKIAEVLRDAAGGDAVVARRGGDGFLIMLEACDGEAARRLGMRFCAEIARETKALGIGAIPMGISASIGVIELRLVAPDVKTCMRNVEIAARAAKTTGRGQVSSWADSDVSMQDAAHQMSLVEQIERVISDNAWQVHEQSILPLGGVDHLAPMRELLIRFPGEAGRQVEASHIVRAAESFGLMPSIDLWMCRYGVDLVRKRLQSIAATTYFVNISAGSIASRTFRADLVDFLSGVERQVLEHLCLEITETAVVENFEAVSAFLRQLRALGIRIAIDDFGAGSSSFRYFAELPADYLKLDGSFVQNVDDPIAMASIECFIRMARVTRLKTIAEHVETDTVLTLLAGLGVDYAQGYAINRPQPVQIA